MEEFLIFPYFSAKNIQTYKIDGITKHMPPMGDVWPDKSLTSEFLSCPSFKVTDEFYGNCNDFNDYFLGKAARGEKFAIRFHKNAEQKFVTHVAIPFGTFEWQPDCTWNLVKYEPLKKCVWSDGSYTYYLLNYLYEQRIGEKSNDLIQASLAAGGDNVWKTIKYSSIA